MPVIGSANGEQYNSMFEASVYDHLKTTEKEFEANQAAAPADHENIDWSSGKPTFPDGSPVDISQQVSEIKRGQPQIDDPFTEASKLGAIRGGPRSGKTTKSNEPPTETSPMYASENITPPKLIYEKQKGDLSLRTYKEEPIYENVTSHGINFEKGSVQGTINIHSLDGGKTVHVGYMGAINTETGQVVRSLGPKSVKDIYAHIKEIYPNVETIQAQRVSGMRAKMDEKYGGKRTHQDLQLDVKTGKVSQRPED